MGFPLCFVIKNRPRVRPVCVLHVRVIRSAGTFRRDPIDVLRGVFDVASFAVHAILPVDFELRFAIQLHHFIHTSRAVTLRGFVVQRQVAADGDGRIGQAQMARLIFFVVGVG